MRASLSYGAAATAVVAVVSLAIWPFLDSVARQGVLIAAAVALPVQVLAFAVLVRVRGRLEGFMAAWVGGIAMRGLVLAIAAFVVFRSGAETAVSVLLALAGFFFALLLLEPIYFPSDSVESPG